MPALETATQLQKFLGLVTYFSLYTLTLLLHCTPTWANEERNRVHMEQILSRSIWQKSSQWSARIPHCCTSMSTSLSLSKLMPPKKASVPPSFKMAPQLPSLPKLLTCGVALCQHRAWTAHLYLWSRTIPYLCLWPCLYYWEWPQASWTNQESGRYMCSSTENAALAPKLWCYYQVLTWERDAGCRCFLLLCTPQGSRDAFRHHHQPCAHHTWQENWVPNSHPRWPVILPSSFI